MNVDFILGCIVGVFLCFLALLSARFVRRGITSERLINMLSEIIHNLNEENERLLKLLESEEKEAR